MSSTKKRLYVSGAITNVPDHRGYFTRSAELLQAAGYETLNPLEIPKCKDILCPKTDHHTWECCLAYDIAEMVFCDGIALLHNWHLSRGAKFERKIMKGLGKPTKLVTTWLLEARDNVIT